MQHISREKLYTDLQYRFDYVSKFVNFGKEDIEAIKASAPLVAPLVSTIVDAVYVKLFSFDITKEIFLKRGNGFDGSLEDNLASLKLDGDQVRFRKDMLTKYLTKLVTAEYNESFIKYLDFVGKIHTSKAGSKAISVEYIHVNALLGYVEDIVLDALLSAQINDDVKKRTIRAFNKLLWIQNDLFARNYVTDGQDLMAKQE